MKKLNKRIIALAVIFLGLFVAIIFCRHKVSSDAAENFADEYVKSVTPKDVDFPKDNIADFYIDLKNSSNEMELHYIGEGELIDCAKETNDIALIKDSIVSIPDYSSLLSENESIQWMSIDYDQNNVVDRKKRVIGEVISKRKEENTATEVDYIVEMGDVLSVDKDTLFDIYSKKNISGEGYLRWDNWKVITDEERLSGNLYIPYINDPIYCSMKLPSDVQTVMGRTNASLGIYQPAGYHRILGIGAFYQVTDSVLPDEFTICLGKLKTYILLDGENEKWQEVESVDKWYRWNFGFYKLPWTLNESSKVPEEKMIADNNFMRFHFTKDDLDSQVLHFWGHDGYYLAENIVGLVTMYEVWTETPEAVGAISAAVANDQRNPQGNISQAFSGRNYKVTTEKTIVMGHNMSDEVYKKCVDSGKSPAVCWDMFNAE